MRPGFQPCSKGARRAIAPPARQSHSGGVPFMLPDSLSCSPTTTRPAGNIGLPMLTQRPGWRVALHPPVDLGKVVPDLAADAVPWWPATFPAPALHGGQRHLEPLGDLSGGDPRGSLLICHGCVLPDSLLTSMHPHATIALRNNGRAPAADQRDGNRAATPGPAPRRCPLVRPESTSRSLTRSTSALAEFHALAGHAGPADGCGDCAAQLERQRSAAGALRAHQRQARQQVDAILGKAVTS